MPAADKLPMRRGIPQRNIVSGQCLTVGAECFTMMKHSMQSVHYFSSAMVSTVSSRASPAYCSHWGNFQLTLTMMRRWDSDGNSHWPVSTSGKSIIRPASIHPTFCACPPCSCQSCSCSTDQQWSSQSCPERGTGCDCEAIGDKSWFQTRREALSESQLCAWALWLSKSLAG